MEEGNDLALSQQQVGVDRGEGVAGPLSSEDYVAPTLMAEGVQDLASMRGMAGRDIVHDMDSGLEAVLGTDEGMGVAMQSSMNVSPSEGESQEAMAGVAADSQGQGSQEAHTTTVAGHSLAAGEGTDANNSQLSGQQEEQSLLSGQQEEQPLLSGQREEQPILSGQRAEQLLLSGQRAEQLLLSGQREEQPLLSGQREEQPLLSGQREEQPPES